MQLGLRRVLALVVLLVSLDNTRLPVSYAAALCDPWVAKMVSVQGLVEVRRAGQTQWIPARLNDLYLRRRPGANRRTKPRGLGLDQPACCPHRSKHDDQAWEGLESNVSRGSILSEEPYTFLAACHSPNQDPYKAKQKSICASLAGVPQNRARPDGRKSIRLSLISSPSSRHALLAPAQCTHDNSAATRLHFYGMEPV